MDRLLDHRSGCDLSSIDKDVDFVVVSLRVNRDAGIHGIVIDQDVREEGFRR
jgi:hypothetical protein